MPLLPSLFGAGRPRQPSTEQKEILRLNSEYAGGLPYAPVTPKVGGDWHFSRAVVQAYMRVVWVYRAVEAISDDAAGLMVGTKSSPKMMEPVKGDHPLAKLLNGQANDLEPGFLLRKRISQQVLLSRNGAFLHVQRARSGDPFALTLLPPGSTKPVPVKVGPKKGQLSHYEFTDPASPLDPPVKYPSEDVRWIRNTHPGSAWLSMTPLEAAGLTVELDYFARVFARSFVVNDGRPGMMVGIEGGEDGEDIDDDELRRIETMFSQGPTGANRVMVVAGKLTAQDMSRSPREVDYAQTRDSAKNEILTAFNVPESVIGNASGRTFDNAGQERTTYYQKTLWNHCKVLDAPFHVDVDGEDSIFAHDFSEIDELQAVQRTREDRAQAEWDKGLITADEYREVTGRDPLDRPASRVIWVKNTGSIPVGPEDDEKALGQVMKDPNAPIPVGGFDAQGNPLTVDPNDPNAQGNPNPNGPPQGGGGTDPQSVLDQLEQGANPDDLAATLVDGVKVTPRESPQPGDEEGHTSSRLLSPIYVPVDQLQPLSG